MKRMTMMREATTIEVLAGEGGRRRWRLGRPAVLAGSVLGLLFMTGHAKPAPESKASARAPAMETEPVVAQQSAIPPEAICGGTNKIDRFLGGRMPIGFYIYLYNWKQNKDTSATDLDEALADMAGRGFNCLYVGGASDSPAWRRLLEQCVEHRIAVIPQLDFAYLRKADDDVAAKAAQAIPFIRKYKDHPAVAAFSVCEEPNVHQMPPLKRYYEAILREVPDAPLHLLVNYLPPFANMEPPYPGIIGTDRYPFWWEFGSGGHRATPAYALNWFTGQMDVYSREALARGAEFQAVFMAGSLEFFGTEQQIRKSFYPEMSEAQRDECLRNFKTNASQKNQGLAEAHDGLYRWWKYYRAPANCTRAMTWLSVQKGARSILLWFWSPLGEDMKGFAHRENGKPGREYNCSITGWDGKGTPQLEEYTETAKELQRYARLIRAMDRELEAEEDAPSKPVFSIVGANLSQQSFSVPGYEGKVVVVVNTAVGSWCDGASPTFLTPKTVYRIDDEGNAIDYVPFVETRVVEGCVLSDKLECVDLETGETVPMDADGFVKFSLRPGGGRILFISPKGGGEWVRMKKAFQL